MTEASKRDDDLEFEVEDDDAEFEAHRRDDTMVIRLPRIRVLPRETSEHLRQAQREVLLAFRSVIDEAIRWTEEPTRERTRRTRIEIR